MGRHLMSIHLTGRYLIGVHLALTLDEHASRAKAATSTSHRAAMRCVGCNQYQALMSSIAEFLHTQEVRCHDRVLSYMFALCGDVPRATVVESCS
jgi:hypothetical protein